VTKDLNTLLTALYVLVDDHVVRPAPGVVIDPISPTVN
jgi:hypothetical protein